ncbi:MAG: DUF2341 domain-containing protein, partial [Candidatus Methanomethylicaceae archaeon]
SYWIQEKVDGQYAIFWVKINEDLSSNPVTIYIYYGDPNLSVTTSNGKNTFIYFNDFDESSDFIAEDGTWQLDAANSVYKYISGGSSLVQSYKNIGITANDGYRTVCKHRSPSSWDSGFLTRYTPGYAYGGIYIGKGESGTKDAGGYGENTWTTLYSVSSPAGTAWHISEALNYGQLYIAYTNGILRYNGSINFHLDSTYIALAAWAGYSAEFDWIFVAKFVYPEPSHGEWGLEIPCLNVAITYGQISTESELTIKIPKITLQEISISASLNWFTPESANDVVKVMASYEYGRYALIILPILMMLIASSKHSSGIAGAITSGLCIAINILIGYEFYSTVVLSWIAAICLLLIIYEVKRGG